MVVVVYGYRTSTMPLPIVLLRLMITFVKDTEAPMWRGVFIACLLLIAMVGNCVFWNQAFYALAHLLVRTRAVLMAALYRKVCSFFDRDNW